MKNSVLMRENMRLNTRLEQAMQMLAKLQYYYPIGGYSSDINAEWSELLDAYYGEGIRPDQVHNAQGNPPASTGNDKEEKHDN